MDTVEISVAELGQLAKGKEGLVLLEVDGAMSMLISHMCRKLKEEGITSTKDKHKLIKGAYVNLRDNSRADLILVFKDTMLINKEKLTKYMSKINSITYMSDYLINYNKYLNMHLY